MKDTEQVGFRCDKDLVARLDTAAKKQLRSRSNLMILFMKEALDKLDKK